MSAAMDLYLSANDSLSFQDMLDIDIKAEIDTLVGGHNDFSGLNFSDLPSLELDDVQDIKWFSTNSNHSTSSINLDFSSGDDMSTMVNPNAVMPVISLAQNNRSPTPTLKESHLTFSPSNIKLATLKQEGKAIKKDLIIKLDENRPIDIKKPVIKTITKVTPILAKPATVRTVTKTATSTLLTFRNAIHRQIAQPISLTHVNNISAVRTMATNTARKHQIVVNNHLYEDDERVYPKPAYSYSCLIAMALKNSRTGSLPVSEIYNFMCKHFPYFKTAPNGWKNSVRHNLSLNKCFEKIEKPAVNGAQRKGCLWAMNPAKISKMDEEVQKWSKKDPLAIKKAMVNPEDLEALERGELKFSCSYDESDNFGDSCGSADSEEGSDSEQETEAAIDTEYEIGQIVDVSAIQGNNDDEEDEVSDLDIEVSDGVFEEMDHDQEVLKMEMALAQKELLEYESTLNNKRRRTFIISK